MTRNKQRFYKDKVFEGGSAGLAQTRTDDFVFCARVLDSRPHRNLRIRA
jgi:hypothetical protein